MSPSPTTKQLAVRGSLWTLFGYGFSQVLRLVSNLILARLLLPEDFGLMALVTLFMQGLQMFSDIGIGPSIIQNKRGQDPLFLRTAWTIQVIRGVLLWLACGIFAFPVARFFDAPLLIYLIPVTGFTAFLGGFTSTALFTLNRKLAMGRITLLELLPQVGSLITMILWGRLHPSVWALVAGGITYSIIRLTISHLLNRDHRDGFAWDPECRRELFHFGRWVFLSTVVSFLATHLDKIMLGRLLSLTELGLYSIAMTLARVAIHTSSRLSSSVVFPLLSRHQDNPPKLIATCMKARRAVLWASGAICSGFAIFAPLFFESLYKSDYAPAGIVSQWLAIHTWTFILTASMDRIPLALGKPRLLFFANLLTTLGMGFAYLGYQFAQLPGFILGMAAANFSAHLFLSLTLPSGRGAMLLQSLIFTLGHGCYTAAALYLLHTLQPRLAFLPYALTVCAAAGLPIATAGLRVFLLIREKKRTRDPQ